MVGADVESDDESGVIVARITSTPDDIDEEDDVDVVEVVEVVEDDVDVVEVVEDASAEATFLSRFRISS